MLHSKIIISAWKCLGNICVLEKSSFNVDSLFFIKYFLKIILCQIYDCHISWYSLFLRFGSL